MPYGAHMQIKLSKTWTVGSPLPGGVGGFGRVFDVTDSEGKLFVAKLVPKAEGAQRELLFGDSIAASRCRNVIPVLDSGEHDDQLVIIMPKASQSLRQHLVAAPGPLQLSEASRILQDIVTALVDLDGEIVHRDLKPENVLLLDDRWCLTDFGISRYAGATTAADTRKFSFTPPYAAPEQWRMEHATGAADVYAFGVIAYELLAGQRPFSGPDYRSQHLFETPPPLTAGTSRLRTLIEECMWKPANLRPRPANLLARLETATVQPAAEGSSRLAQANQEESERLARDHAEAAQTQQQAENNVAIFKVAEQSFNSLAEPMLAAIEADAPLASIERNAGHGTMHFVAKLRAGKIGLSKPTKVEAWNGPFTVVSEAAVSVTTERKQGGYEGRSHSLWFCDAHEEGRFGWYETAFMQSPLLGSASSIEPFSADPGSGAIAFSPVMGTKQLAWPVEELDRSNPTEFIDRWIGWFADAAIGELHHPSTMPEKPTDGSWRHS